MNPWEVLGLEPGATPEVIASAYRRKCRECHPDTGGSAEAFRQVEEAYQLLTSPCYGLDPDLLAELSSTLSEVLRTLVEADVDPSTRDVVQLMREALVQRKEELRAKVVELGATVKALRDVAQRFKGGDVLKRLVVDELNKFDEVKAALNNAIRTSDAALTYLKGVSFDIKTLRSLNRSPFKDLFTWSQLK